jgi:hypothetical protein
MQDNIRYYKRLEHDADMIEARISALENIAAKYAAYCEERQRLEIQSYIIDRAQHQAAVDRLAALRDKVMQNRREIERLSTDMGIWGISYPTICKRIGKGFADMGSKLFGSPKCLQM